jgi:Sulfatase
MGFTNRRDFLKLVGMEAATPALLSLGRTASRIRPNVVFILGDDIGYRDLSCYGATRVRTPNVDRLAKEGVRFTMRTRPPRSARRRAIRFLRVSMPGAIQPRTTFSTVRIR